MEIVSSTLVSVIIGLGTITGLLSIILVLGIIAIGLVEYIYKDQLKYIQDIKSNIIYFNNLGKLYKNNIDVSDHKITEEIIELFKEREYINQSKITDKHGSGDE